MRQIMIGESGLGVAAAWSRHPGASHLRGSFRPMDLRRRTRRRGRFASTMGVVPVATPEAYTLGDRWSAAMPPAQNLEGIGKFIKKLKKPLKKAIKIGAIGAALYFSAGAAMPLIQKLRSGGFGGKMPKLPKEIAGLARDAITGRVVDMAPTAPGSYGYYDSRGMLPGQSDPYYTPSGYGGDAYSALQPWEQPDQGGGAQEAGIAGMSPKTLLLAGGVIAAVFLMSRAGATRSRR